MKDQSHRLPDDSNANDDPRLFKAVQEYLDGLEQGRRINRRELIDKYPDIAVELADCLDALAFVNSAANEMSGASSERRSSPHHPGKSEMDADTAQPLGDFKLLREIGHGGMGTVYEATQLSLGRRVAVKVLPLAAALDERHLERFHNEAQAAARLHHTNIVPVFAVGCERSVHFYAMQLIDGQSLADVIKDLRTLADRPTSITRAPLRTSDSADTLTTLRAAHSAAYFRSVAKLALQVAEALSYAHDAGVVHRDIKPANLLLDAHGKLWVTDFGLAQLNVDTGLTRSGDLIGTLRYMSPEQASGRAVVLDQRTDIYSLGITLYELLTLQRALPGTTHEQLLYQIVHHQPLSPRAIDKAIPRELETIVNKAISKDAVDRYASADAFAEDLRRFLRDEPILARPPSLLDKGIKWTRRHKALTAAVIAALALATLGFSVSTILIAREQQRTEVEYQKEREAAITAKVQRIRAERSGRLARQAVEFFSRIASEEMDKPGFSDIRREMLEESLSYYQSFLEDVGDSPSVNAELTSSRAQVSTFLKRYTALDTLLRTSDRIRLLGNAGVRGELGVRPSQVAALLSLASTPPVNNREADPATQAKAFGDQITTMESALGKTLNSTQSRRLMELDRQKRGPLTLSDPEVIERLKLTDAQQAQIRAILIRYRNTRETRPGDHGEDGSPHFRDDWDGPRGGGPPRHENDHNFEDFSRAQIRARTLQEILSLLTPTQRTDWNQLLGKSFPVESIRPLPFDDANAEHGPRPHFDRNPPDGDL